MTLSYTKNLHLAVPDFLTEPWHVEFAQAMDSIDRILFSAVVASNTTLWENSTNYAIGDLVIDPDTGGIYSSAVAHTSSPIPMTFSQEIAAFPTRWTAFAPVLASQAEAEAGIENTKYMSPLRVAQAIDVQAQSAGIASTAEAIAGINDTQMMTPLKVVQSIGARTRGVPQGRLTLISDTPVMTSAITGATNIYYTPFIGTTIPVWNASTGQFDQVDCWDQLRGVTTGTPKDGGAIGPIAANDWFVWADDAPVTISIAAPAVVTYANHALLPGHPIQFSTTGNLPVGISADTTYYVMTAGFTANTFQIEAGRGSGTPINTSGAQAGTHTLHTRRLTHGPNWVNDQTRSQVIVKFRGIWVSNGALPNGKIGTYVGSTRAIGGGQLAWVPNAGDASTPAMLLVYNAYNRVAVVGSRQDPTGTWVYGAGVTRPSNNNVGNRVWVLDGLGDSYARASFGQLVFVPEAGSVGQISFASVYGTGAGVGGIIRFATTGAGATTGYVTLTTTFDILPAMGAYYVQAQEYGAQGGNPSPLTFFGGGHYALTLAISL